MSGVLVLAAMKAFRRKEITGFSCRSWCVLLAVAVFG
jgi:hypothetical protein